jgi:hypothetical protein
VPSAMIFDDHDVIDDWNTSQAVGARDPAQAVVARAHRQRLHVLLGLPAPRATCARGAGRGRDLAARAQRREDVHRAAASAGPADAEKHTGDALQLPPRLRAHAADRDGLARRARAGRDAGDGRRRGVGVDRRPCHAATSTTSCSAPRCRLLAPAIHHLEAWNEAVCGGAWGGSRRATGSACARASTRALGGVQRLVPAAGAG